MFTINNSKMFGVGSKEAEILQNTFQVLFTYLSYKKITVIKNINIGSIRWIIFMYIAKQVFNNALRRKSMFSIKKFENISNIDIKMMK